jgi:hypothetical protein
MGDQFELKVNLKLGPAIIAYLCLPPLAQEALHEAPTSVPDQRFLDVVSGMLVEYLEKGVMPPAEVAPAIINLADDHLSNRPMILRAGDYITIQNYIRKEG